MTENNDHDLLVKLDTKVEFLIRQQTDFIEKYEKRHSELAARVSALENSDSKDSEKFRAITEDVRRSLANHEAILALETKATFIEKKLDGLAGTSKLWDILIAIGATAAFLATLFKP